jgi:hypothetical protein
MATKIRHLPDPALALAHAAPEQAALPDALDYTEEEVDESLEESFPASDPPSWAGMLRIGKPRRRLA